MIVNMGTVWDRTTEFLSGNLTALTQIALATIFLPQAISDAFNQAGNQPGPAIAPLAVQGIGLLCALIALWGQLAVVALALNPEAGHRNARAAAVRGYGRAVLVMVVIFVAMAILALPVLGVLVASGVDLTQVAGAGGAAMTPDMSLDISLGAGVFLSLYGVALLMVLLFVGVRLAPVYPVILAENKGLAAIGRSFAVTRGITWKLVGVYLLFLVVFAVAAGAVRSVFGVIAGLIAPGDGPFTVATIVTALAGALVTTAFTVTVAAFSAKLYRAIVSSRPVPSALA